MPRRHHISFEEAAERIALKHNAQAIRAARRARDDRRMAMLEERV